MSKPPATSPTSMTAKLTKGSITGHLVGQTLPAIVGVTAVMSIGLVDAYFIGQLGPEALAAIAFIFPVTVALASLGVGVMVGINSVVARALGEDDGPSCARRANFGLVFAVVIGILIGALLYALSEPLFALMNAPAHLRGLILEYMQPYALGYPLILAIMGFNGVLRGQGEAKRTSYISITYAAANWILDPILITGAFGFEGYGIAGAAYATIIGYSVGLILAYILLRQTDLPFDPSLIREGSWVDPAVSILRVAGPASLSNSLVGPHGRHRNARRSSSRSLWCSRPTAGISGRSLACAIWFNRRDCGAKLGCKRVRTRAPSSALCFRLLPRLGTLIGDDHRPARLVVCGILHQ